METGRTLSFVRTAEDKNLYSANVFGETQSNLGNVSRLHTEYPEPLTGTQRRLFSRHVAQSIRKYNIIHRSTEAVRRGYESLKGLVERLKVERAEIVAYLERKAAPNIKESVSVKELAACQERERVEDAKRLKMEPSSGALPPSESNTRAMPAARRRFGGLLRSAAFANMQKVLLTAQKEEEEHSATVTQQRERIAKQTRLSMLQEDLDNQEKLIDPLEQKLRKCDALEDETKSMLLPLLELWGEMFRQEARYAASFALRAAGPSNSWVEHVTGVLPDNAAGCEDNESAKSDRPTNFLLDSSRTGSVVIAVNVAYEIPFIPTSLPPEAEDIVRSQIEEVLDSYLSYRARVDPILKEIEENLRERHTQRAKQLMEVIGIGASEGRDMIDLGFGSGADLVSGAIPNPLDVVSTADKSFEVRKRIKTSFGISDESSNEDGADDGVLKDPGHTTPDNAKDHDQMERRKIQSALSALDDFEEMY